MSEPPKRLAYGINDAARALSVSRSKLYEMIAAGELKVVKLGSRTLILHEELERFITGLRVAAILK